MCVFFVNSLHQTVTDLMFHWAAGTHLLWSSSGYSERSSVATCQLSSGEERPSRTYSKVGHLFVVSLGIIVSFGHLEPLQDNINGI